MDNKQAAAVLREMIANDEAVPVWAEEELGAVKRGADALEAQEIKVTRVMDPDAAAYHARLALHLDRIEAIYERIARALEPKEQGRWRIMVRGIHGTPFLVPEADYQQAIESDKLIGTAVYAEDVVITGWERKEDEGYK